MNGDGKTSVSREVVVDASLGNIVAVEGTIEGDVICLFRDGLALSIKGARELAFQMLEAAGWTPYTPFTDEAQRERLGLR